MEYCNRCPQLGSSFPLLMELVSRNEVKIDRNAFHPHIRAFSSQYSSSLVRSGSECLQVDARFVRWMRNSSGGSGKTREFRLEWNRLNFGGVVTIDELSSDQ